MAMDVTRQIGAVRREVRNGERDGKPTRTVVATQTYDTDIEDVWDACTSAERIPRWFLPVSGDLHLGGRYQFEGNAGGEILTCDKPRQLAVTWEFGGGITWLAVRLSTNPAGGTTLELEHTAVVEEHWGQFGPGAVGIGWDMSLMGLSGHLSGSMSVDPKAAAEWQASDEAKEFMTQSSEQWCLADIANGEDKAVAEAAAARTIAAYTGAAPPEPQAG